MSQVAATGVSRPTIGDILLSHGFVDSDTLAGAAEEQERTGQPLGQILVERGAITRLELASALAEQWAEAPAPGRLSAVPNDSAPASAPAWDSPDDRAVIDDDTYALRVQSAVTDLARRVGAAEPLLAELERLASTSISPEDFEANLADVRARVDASLARVSGIETALENVGTRLDQLTDGVEEAFTDIQGGTAELAERLSTAVAAAGAAAASGDLYALRQSLESRLTQVSESIEAESRRLSETQSTLAVLAERPVADPGIEAHVRQLTARLDGVARADDLADLRAALEVVAGRLAETAEAKALAEIRHDLDELSLQTEAHPVTENRLDRLEEQLKDAARSDAVAELERTFGDLRTRIESSADAASLEALRARIDALPSSASEPGRLDGIEATLAELAGRIESLGAVTASGSDAAAIEELRGALEELGRRRHGDEETILRLDAVTARVEELAARPADTELTERVDSLAQALDQALADPSMGQIQAAVSELRERGSAGESAVSELSGRLEQQSAELAALRADPGVDALRAKVETLAEHRLSGAADIADLAGRIEHLSAGLSALQADESANALRADVDGIRRRLETDDASLAELRAAASELASRPAGDPELAARLGIVAARVDELAEAAATAADTDGLAQLGVELAGARAELVAGLQAVTDRVSALEGAPHSDPDAGFAALRDELSEQLREGLAGLTAEAPSGEIVWEAAAARLEERIDALAALVGDGSDGASVDDGAKSARRTATPVGPESDTERELERLRMAIERMAMHLGEQERALAEVMRTRGVTERLDEIEARIDDLATGAVATGAGPAQPGAVPAGSSADARALARRLDGAEAMLEAEREKLMTKLDRMASSIDWRLQRLEAGDTQQ